MRKGRRKRFAHRASSVQKRAEKEGNVRTYRDQQDGVRRESANVGEKKGAKQVRSEDKKEAAKTRKEKV